ncbi:hypothetical protein FFLO_06892 [Filobasidium floriforme]|uniref:Uncharacterized protein n=1 Tax=Filobasidium floriforme TaxID=5210 RepID=A0A8K0JFZ3_9TREE|nr:uncharacterized protein HD553DRAFT_44802 [Filobasidium floriforme]KAG7527477.1 hypothetical protein FFLO_06892 [Filobasidium floriforme]KAH8084263.1 hypothetical protein HD553DRAFT_44802 [Filobasidium floriforme]
MSTASPSASNGTSSFHSRPHSPAYHHSRQNNTPHQHRHQHHQNHLQNHVAPKHSSTSSSISPPAHAHAHHRPSGPNKRSIASSSGLVASTKIKGMKSPEKRERERDRKRERQVGHNQQDLGLGRDTVPVDEHVGSRADKVGGMEECDGSSGVEASVRDQAGGSGSGSGWEIGKEDYRSGWSSSVGHGCLPPTPTSATKFGSSGSTDPQLLPETPTRTPRGLSRDPVSSAILPQTPTSPVRVITGAPSTSPRSLGYSFPTFKSSLSPPIIQDQHTGRGEAGAEQEHEGRASLWLNKSEGGKKRDHREVELGSREGSPVGDVENEQPQRDRGERTTASWPKANGVDQGALPSTSRPRSDLGPTLAEHTPHHGFQGSKSDSHIPAPPNAAPERPRSIPSQPPSVPAVQMQNHPPHPRRMYAYNATSAEEEARRAILVDACEGLSSLCSQWHGSEYNKLKFGEKVLSLDDRRSAACPIDHDGSGDVRERDLCCRRRFWERQSGFFDW